MAKLSAIMKNNRRVKMAKHYEPIRRKLREQVADMSLPEEERLAAGIKLQKLPRNGSKIRVRNRCVLTGRPRGNFQKFGLSRMKFRELAHAGLIPGVTKASW
jgi:small subunit ribosomal protein S14